MLKEVCGWCKVFEDNPATPEAQEKTLKEQLKKILQDVPQALTFACNTATSKLEGQSVICQMPLPLN